MSKLVLFLKTIRLPNLLMLALVQYLVCSYLLQVFTIPFYILVTLATTLIALGGYLLNDIQDLAIDETNKKLKWIKDTNKLQAKKLSYTALFVGLVLGLILSLQSSITLFPWFVFAAFTLILYAHYFSKNKLIGNLLISGLIALAILLCFYLGIEHPAFTRKYFNMNEIGVWVYSGIAFLLNWIREIVKDMEDMEGDRLGGRRTLPLLIGMRLTKGIIAFILMFFIFIFVFIHLRYDGELLFSFYLVALMVLAGLAAGQLFISKKSEDYHKVSTLIKWLMFLGLFLPVSNFI